MNNPTTAPSLLELGPTTSSRLLLNQTSPNLEPSSNPNNNKKYYFHMAFKNIYILLKLDNKAAV